MQSKCPCWWEGPDGSRVLMMYMPGYAQAQGWGLDTSVETARPRVLANLASYEGRKDYPYDAVFLHGAVSDNQPLNAKLAEVAKAVERALRVPQDHPLATTPSSSSTSRSTTATSCRSSAAARARTGKTAPARRPGRRRSCRNAQEALATGESSWPWPDRIDPEEAVSGRRNLPGLAELPALRRAHLGRLLLDQPAGERVHQGPVEDQGPVRRGRRSQRSTSSCAGARRWRRWCGPTGRRWSSSTRRSWPRTDMSRCSLPEGMAVADPDVVSCETPEGTLLSSRTCRPAATACSSWPPGRSRPRSSRRRAKPIESQFYRVRVRPGQRRDHEHPRQGTRIASWSTRRRRTAQPVRLRGRRQGHADRVEPERAGSRSSPSPFRRRRRSSGTPCRASAS